MWYNNKLHRPKEESTLTFFKRYFNTFCDSLVNPKRLEYSPPDVTAVISGDSHIFNQMQFQVYSRGKILTSCLWKRKSVSKSNQQVCIIYLHTNTRALIDASEVIPAASAFENVSVAAFDLPGCGKSEGCLSGEVWKDLQLIIEWITCLIAPDVRIILWARGMATAAAVEFISKGFPTSTTISKSTSSDRQSTSLKSVSSEKNIVPLSSTLVKAAVLDSPFKSICEMISDAVSTLHGRGYSISKNLIEVCSKMVIQTLCSRLDGFNPMDVKPIKLVDKCIVPVYIMAATQDDYIAPTHGKAMAEGWAGPVKYTTFCGSHFGKRSPDLATAALAFVAQFLMIEPITDISNILEEERVKKIDMGDEIVSGEGIDVARDTFEFVDIDVDLDDVSWGSCEREKDAKGESRREALPMSVCAKSDDRQGCGGTTGLGLAFRNSLSRSPSWINSSLSRTLSKSASSTALVPAESQGLC